MPHVHSPAGHLRQQLRRKFRRTYADELLTNAGMGSAHSDTDVSSMASSPDSEATVASEADLTLDDWPRVHSRVLSIQKVPSVIIHHIGDDTLHDTFGIEHEYDCDWKSESMSHDWPRAESKVLCIQKFPSVVVHMIEDETPDDNFGIEGGYECDWTSGFAVSLPSFFHARKKHKYWQYPRPYSAPPRNLVHYWRAGSGASPLPVMRASRPAGLENKAATDPLTLSSDVVWYSTSKPVETSDGVIHAPFTTEVKQILVIKNTFIDYIDVNASAVCLPRSSSTPAAARLCQVPSDVKLVSRVMRRLPMLPLQCIEGHKPIPTERTPWHLSLLPVPTLEGEGTAIEKLRRYKTRLTEKHGLDIEAAREVSNRMLHSMLPKSR